LDFINGSNVTHVYCLDKMKGKFNGIMIYGGHYGVCVEKFSFVCILFCILYKEKRVERENRKRKFIIIGNYYYF
jgi:hypothetical protein